MDINKYKIVFSPTSKKQFKKIYKHISNNSSEKNVALKLMKEIEDKVKLLEYAPHIHIKIGKKDSKNHEYRRLIVKNYIILYIILEEKKKVRITHIFYNKSDYFNKL